MFMFHFLHFCLYFFLVPYKCIIPLYFLPTKSFFICQLIHKNAWNILGLAFPLIQKFCMSRTNRPKGLIFLLTVDKWAVHPTPENPFPSVLLFDKYEDRELVRAVIPHISSCSGFQGFVEYNGNHLVDE